METLEVIPEMEAVNPEAEAVNPEMAIPEAEAVKTKQNK
ncbi:unknown [Dorea sp. CAG:105]|nr:unknown [Dorea sp. CAG:105]